MGKLLVLFLVYSGSIQEDSTRLANIRKEIISTYRSDKESALKLASDRLELSKASSLYLEMADTENLIAGIYRFYQETDSAASHYQKAINMSLAAGEESLATKYYDFLGRNYRDAPEPEPVLAMENHLKGLAIRESIGDLAGIAKSYNYLGILNAKFGLYDESLEFFKKCLNINLQKADTSQSLITLNSIANSYSELSFFDSAKIVIDQFEQMVTQSDNGNMAKLFFLKGKYFLDIEDYDSSLMNYNKTLQIQLQEPYLNPINTYNNLGYVFLQIGNYDRSREYLLRSKALVNTRTPDELLSKLYSNLFELLEVTNSGTAEEKLEYLRKVEDIRRRLNDTNKQIVAKGLELKYESGKKDQMIQSQKATIQLRTRIQLVSTLLLLAVIILIILRYITTKKAARQDKDLHVEKVNQLLAHQELKMIQAMIQGEEKERSRIAEDLHDRLGSTLAATRMHVEVLEEIASREANGKAILIKELLDKAIEDTRQISHNMLSGVLTKFGLIAALEDIKETVESANRVSIELEYNSSFNESFNQEEELQLFRVIQELISNALKHAHADHIVINLDESEGFHVIRITDDGIGFDVNAVDKGMGLKNIKSRLEKINATWDISSTAGGTGIEIKLAA